MHEIDPLSLSLASVSHPTDLRDLGKERHVPAFEHTYQGHACRRSLRYGRRMLSLHPVLPMVIPPLNSCIKNHIPRHDAGRHSGCAQAGYQHQHTGSGIEQQIGSQMPEMAPLAPTMGN